MNRIVFGDNLEILGTIPASSVDLIYIDPPFNTVSREDGIER
jgi:DNA modification methylase